MGSVSQMPKKNEYVPMFWGRAKQSQWDQRVTQMQKSPPKHLMAFNEPDVPSQSNMGATDAAGLYMNQIYPLAKKGTVLGSPAIVWDLNWMNDFLNAVKKRGGHVDFICLHWHVVSCIILSHILTHALGRYGSWNDLASFKKYVTSAHSRFGKPIWVTEFGITTASHPSQQQVKSFMMNAFTWLDSQSYVERAAWFGRLTFFLYPLTH